MDAKENIKVETKKLNNTTIAAIEEAISGKELENFDLEAFGIYVQSMK